MRYRRLAYFVAVAEEQSFTRAAQRLHMAQPPLSQQIALLEKEIGTPLFDRSHRAVRLTAAGAALLPEARRLLADLDETVRMVRGVGEGTIGRLTVGFIPSAMNGVLPDLVREFRATHPGVDLTLREMAPDALVHAVLERRLDVAVLYLPLDEPDLAHRRLACEELLLALPEAHPAAAASAVALADVAREPFVLQERYDVPGLHAAVTALFADAGITPRVAQRGVWLIQTVLGLVAAGIGLALVPSSAATLRRSGVVLRPLSGPARRVELAAFWRRDEASPPLDEFLAVQERMAGAPPSGKPHS
ncbi:MAG TPA: LysR substrate-binding domain-containing protein [Pseudonocardia sp.]|uniref:LysR family transcriptional regulator n=1 Tax=Pseudonocardia sp. TaxID=60912 RepID=UPI002B4AB515|nr:LysR substrate-binding domain-containing protein [Pseudonocardia sp.]HLU54106.1 LysR substrate-binding domain-containing protein [Pseudonocardia sp.]